MKKRRAVLIGMVLAAAQVAPAPVSADEIQTFRNVRTNRCMDDSHLGFRTLECDLRPNPHQQWKVHIWEDKTRELKNVAIVLSVAMLGAHAQVDIAAESYEAFDQTPGRGWRALAEDAKYQEAATLITLVHVGQLALSWGEGQRHDRIMETASPAQRMTP